MAVFSDLFPGLSQMANVHPILVHFPIGLLFSFWMVEVLAVLAGRESLRRAASWMLYLGTLGAIAAVFAGFEAAATVEHDDVVHEIMERHEMLGLSVLGMAVLLSLWRLLRRARFSRFGQTLHLVLGLAMIVTMAFGTDLGGLMVYHHGVGVRAMHNEIEQQFEELTKNRDETVPEASEEIGKVPPSVPENQHPKPPQAETGKAHIHKHRHRHGKNGADKHSPAP
ncbi:MAG TPA: DUF2231 domain-containing protein [Methylococcus sp.]|nr:DUF2231 domain-containing protein [Methylococcus sp.]